VIISSTRAAAGVYPDRTGPVIAAWLRERGFEVNGPVVVADAELPGALAAAVGSVAVVITSGGTGLSPTDRTPEATRELLDREVPGLAEAIRLRGSASVPTAALSRGLAGIAGGTLVVNLPGSTGGVRDGLAVLEDVLEHALEQIAGGDHPRPPDEIHGAATGSE
jgi:molybdenum cofactor synthesis domain-containing protein